MGEKNRKDSKFKKQFRINDMKLLDNKSVNFNCTDVYTPDLIFYDEKNVVILEQSSNSNRKVHIAELTQFVEYVLNNRILTSKIENKGLKRKFSYILILTPSTEEDLNKKTEANRLRCYWNMFKKLDKNIINKINFIGVTDFKSLNNSFSKIDFDVLKKICEIV